jgi:hypothetical protein
MPSPNSPREELPELAYNEDLPSREEVNLSGADMSKYIEESRKFFARRRHESEARRPRFARGLDRASDEFY